MTETRKYLESKGVVYPLNWDELGSSAKDLFEEAMLRTIEKAKESK